MGELNLKDLFKTELQGTRLVIEGIPYTEASFKKAFPELMKPHGSLPEVKGVLAEWVMNKDSASRFYLSELNRLKRETQHVESLGLKEFDMENIEPVIVMNKESNEEVLFYNKSKGKKENIKLSAFRRLLGAKKADDYIASAGNIVMAVYNPRESRILYDEEEYTVFNTYEAPSYKSLTATPELHPVWIKFLEHLFPVKSDREFVYDWIHYSLTDRPFSFLCLYSTAQQTGKSTFSENLMVALHGKHNSTPVKGNFPSPRFNSLMDSKTYLHGEEYALTGNYRYEKYEALKGLTSDNVKLEAKNKDEYTARLYFSACFTGNIMTPFPIVASEVRFSFPEITKARLDSNEWVDELYDTFEDDQVLANAAEYFIQREPKYKVRDTLINDKFYDMVKFNAHKFIKFIIKWVKENKDNEGGCLSEITLDDLAHIFKRENRSNNLYLPSESSVASFFDTYVEDGVRIADVYFEEEYIVKPLNDYAVGSEGHEDL